MTLQVDFWQLAGFAISGLGFVWAIVFGAGRMLGAQYERRLDERFAALEQARSSNHDQLAKRLDGIESANREESAQWQRVERELLRFQADMPLNYVRREDYIRGQSVIEAKLDGLGTKLENAQLRALKNAP